MLTLESINDFYEAQFQQWPQLRERYDALLKTERRIESVDDMAIGLQFNPARIKSTAAKTDVSSLAKRPCFLCKANRPEQQQSLHLIEGWDCLINPFPIFPVHLTIASKAHEPQEETPLDMVAAADQAPELVFFYNGARAGASAPDHLHFQATLKEELPIIPIVEQFHSTQESGIMLSTQFPITLPMTFWSLVILPDPEGMQLLSVLPKLHGFDAVTGAPDPGMVNVLVWMDINHKLRIVVFPRKKHRPDLYFSPSEENRLLVSPGAVDMSGLIILPREKEFQSLTPHQISKIYSECGFSHKELREYKPLQK